MAISCHRWDVLLFASRSSREIDLFDLNGTIAEAPSSVAFWMISSIRSFSGKACRRTISTDDSVEDRKTSKIRSEAFLSESERILPLKSFPPESVTVRMLPTRPPSKRRDSDGGTCLHTLLH